MLTSLCVADVLSFSLCQHDLMLMYAGKNLGETVTTPCYHIAVRHMDELELSMGTPARLLCLISHVPERAQTRRVWWEMLVVAL